LTPSSSRLEGGPAAVAGRSAARLLRRVWLDLLGLPPEPAAIDAFLADDSPDAYEKVVARLLASPHHGERWGRHWLDAARYADSDGYEKDKPRDVWMYRDWVVDALNADIPLTNSRSSNSPATCCPTPRRRSRSRGLPPLHDGQRRAGTDGRRTASTALRPRQHDGHGLARHDPGCAQCHNHKYDPVTQRYYRPVRLLQRRDRDKLRPQRQPQWTSWSGVGCRCARDRAGPARTGGQGLTTLGRRRRSRWQNGVAANRKPRDCSAGD
jgi:hypothetical protein